MLFQYQAGPAASYRLISASANGHVWPNWSGNARIGVRVDSGDIAAQCALYFEQMKRAGIPPRMIVFEDEVTPDGVRKVYDHFRQATGVAVHLS